MISLARKGSGTAVIASKQQKQLPRSPQIHSTTGTTSTLIRDEGKVLVQENLTNIQNLATVAVVQAAPQQVVLNKQPTRLGKNHPRIKYSMKHPVPPLIGQQHQQHQPQIVGITPHLVTTTSAIPPITLSVLSNAKQLQQFQYQTVAPANKMEYLNFALSRKQIQPYAQEVDITKAAIASILPNNAITNNNTLSNSNANQVSTSGSAKTQVLELQSSIISELSNYEIDDIELPDGTKIGFSDSTIETIERDQQYNRSSANSSIAEDEGDGEKAGYQFSESGEEIGRQYECRHCGKKYRWKSTLRRHENVECGGKEPMHQCPHCSYKAKQRGNLGVHIRKHHAELPQLESRRKNRSI